MTVCGITAEYNPFHTGHLHHIAETRRSLGENAVIVCVMSGNFVQRGDFAVLDKYARAEMAVRCGADLVVELPLAAALSSAELRQGCGADAARTRVRHGIVRRGDCGYGFAFTGGRTPEQPADGG